MAVGASKGLCRRHATDEIKEKNYLNKANQFYKSISMNPIMVKKERPG